MLKVISPIQCSVLRAGVLDPLLAWQPEYIERVGLWPTDKFSREECRYAPRAPALSGRCHGDILHTINLKCHRKALDRSTKTCLPENFPSRDIKGPEVTVIITSKDESAACRQCSSEEGGPLLDTPDLLHVNRLICS